MPKNRPSVLAVLSLKCLYCRQTTLQKPGSWFYFRQGCSECDYRFERESGYFTGASWMIGYPLLAGQGLGLCALFKLWIFPGWHINAVIALVSVISLFLTALLHPFSMAIWMYLDHHLHPLGDGDSYSDPAQH